MVVFALLADLSAAGKPLDAEGGVPRSSSATSPSATVAAAVGAQAFGHEPKHAPSDPPWPSRSSRVRLLVGKTAAAAPAGTAGALLASAASLALLLVMARWEPSVLADPRLWRSLAYGAVTVGSVAAAAAGVSALTRGTGLTVALLAPWAGNLEPLVAAVLGGGAGLLPFLSMPRPPPTPVTPWTSALPARCRR